MQADAVKDGSVVPWEAEWFILVSSQLPLRTSWKCLLSLTPSLETKAFLGLLTLTSSRLSSRVSLHT